MSNPIRTSLELHRTLIKHPKQQRDHRMPGRANQRRAARRRQQIPLQSVRLETERDTSHASHTPPARAQSPAHAVRLRP